MRKFLILGALLLIVAGALFFAAKNLNRYLEDNRAWLAEQASAALGRSVAFGEIGVSLRGGLGARVSDVAIGEDPAFGKGDVLRAGRIDALIAILPALRGRYEIAHVEIDAPEIRVIKTHTGFNFDSLGRASARDERTSGTGALPLLVSSLRIRGGRLQFIDRSASPASELSVEQLDFSASDVSLDHAIELEIAAAILGAAQQNVRATGTLGPVRSLDAAASAPVDLRIDLGPLIVDRLKKLALIGPAIPPELSSPDPIALGVALSGSLDALGTIVSLKASDAAIAYGGKFAKPRGVRFELDADVKRAADAIDVANLDLRLANAQLIGSGRIGLAAGMPIDFQLSGSKLPLDGWGGLIPAAAAFETTGAVDLRLNVKGPVAGGQIPRLDGTLALQRVSARQPGGDTRIEDLTTTLTLKGDRVEMPPTDFRLNGNPVRVAATVKNLSRFDTDFSVTSPALDVAALGAAGDRVKQREVLEDVELRGNFRVASGGPQLDATLRSTAGSLRDIAYQKLDGVASLRNQKLSFEQLTLSAFDGSIAGTGSYDLAKPDAPAFLFRGKFDGLDIAALLAQLGAGRALQLAGRLDADIDLGGRGSQWDVIRQTLSGTGAFEVSDGVLKGVNLAERIFAGVTGIPGLSQLISTSVHGKYPQLFGVDDTVFEVLAGKLTLKDGQAIFDQIALAARDYRLDGNGTLQLDNALDIGMTFVASQDLSADLIGSVKQIKYLTDTAGRFNLPLRLAGSLPSIRAMPDAQYVTRQLSQGLVQTGIAKGIEALVGKPKSPDRTAKSETGSQGQAAAESDAESATPGSEPATPGSEPAAHRSEPAAPTPTRDPAEELIRRGIGALLGGNQE